MIKQCEMCKKEFETINPNKKYCSDECRKVRIREADKLKKREARKEVRDIKNTEKKEKNQVNMEKREQEYALRKVQRDEELKKRVEAGDPLARMDVAETNGIEYWEAYKQYTIEYAESWGRTSTSTINDISVHEPDFAEKVVQSIHELGRICGRS